MFGKPKHVLLSMNGLVCIDQIIPGQIIVSEILALDRNSYLTRVTYPGCHTWTVHWLYWSSHTW